MGTSSMLWWQMLSCEHLRCCYGSCCHVNIFYAVMVAVVVWTSPVLWWQLLLCEPLLCRDGSCCHVNICALMAAIVWTTSVLWWQLLCEHLLCCDSSCCHVNISCAANPAMAIHTVTLWLGGLEFSQCLPFACHKRQLIMGYKLSYTTGLLYAWSSCMQWGVWVWEVGHWVVLVQVKYCSKSVFLFS